MKQGQLIIPEESRPVFDYHLIRGAEKHKDKPWAQRILANRGVQGQGSVMGDANPSLQELANNSSTNSILEAKPQPMKQIESFDDVFNKSGVATPINPKATLQNDIINRYEPPQPFEAAEDIDLDKGDAALQQQIKQAKPQQAPVTPATQKQSVTQEQKPQSALDIIKSYSGNMVDFLKSPTFRSTSAQALVDFANSLAQNKPTGQMVDGIFVPDTGLGSQISDMPSVTQAREQQEFSNNLATEEMKQRSEDRKANIAYRNKILDDKEEEKRRARENFIYQNQVALQELGRARGLFNSGGKDYFGASVPEKAAKNSWKWLVGDSKGTHDVSKYDAIKNIFNSETIKNMRATIGAQFTADESKAYQELSSAANLTPDQFEEKFTVAYNGFARNLGMPLATREEIFPSDDSKQQNFRVVE